MAVDCLFVCVFGWLVGQLVCWFVGWLFDYCCCGGDVSGGVGVVVTVVVDGVGGVVAVVFVGGGCFNGGVGVGAIVNSLWLLFCS